VRLQFFEDGDLSHGSGGDSLIFVFEFDLFNCHEILLVEVSGLEDNSVGALAESL